jgi:GNAT superfamily N-acetyltransferase
MCQLVVFRHIQHRGGLCMEIESVHVDATRRSAGIGTSLMAAAIEAARLRGCYRIQLTSDLTRTDAHRWYARLGFEPSHRGFKYYLT